MNSIDVAATGVTGATGSTASAFFFAGAFFAAGFFSSSAGFFAAGFLAAGFFSALATGFSATDFSEVGFFAAGFLAAGFFFGSVEPVSISSTIAGALQAALTGPHSPGSKPKNPRWLLLQPTKPNEAYTTENSCPMGLTESDRYSKTYVAEGVASATIFKYDRREAI